MQFLFVKEYAMSISIAAHKSPTVYYHVNGYESSWGTPFCSLSSPAEGNHTREEVTITKEEPKTKILFFPKHFIWWQYTRTSWAWRAAGFLESLEGDKKNKLKPKTIWTFKTIYQGKDRQGWKELNKIYSFNWFHKPLVCLIWRNQKCPQLYLIQSHMSSHGQQFVINCYPVEIIEEVLV